MRRPFTPSSSAGGEVLGRPIDARRVHRVLAADRVERQRALLHRLGEGADLVERARERDTPVARDASVGRLHRHDAAQRPRLADRAAGVAAQRDRGHAGAHAGGRAARRAARHAIEVPGVVGRAERGVLGRGAERELVHVELAHGQHAGVRAASRPRCSRRRSRSPRGSSTSTSSSCRSGSCCP